MGGSGGERQGRGVRERRNPRFPFTGVARGGENDGFAPLSGLHVYPESAFDFFLVMKYT